MVSVLADLFPIYYCSPMIVTQSYDMGLTVDIIFFYFHKAFDVVNNVLLLKMLASIGVEGCLFGWLKDHLFDRKLRVVQVNQSCHLSVSSGALLRSVTGSLLFLVNTNHIGSHLCCKFCLFADNLKLYLTSSLSKSDDLLSHNMLQCDINLH